MFIPTGMKYTATSWGGMIKEVRCAYCGVEYVYEIRRRVESQSSAPLFLGMEGAKMRASMGAHSLLVRTLEKEHDMVPCPGCGRLQPAMNRQMRKAWVAGLAVVWVATLMAAFFGMMAAEGNRRDPGAWTKILPAMSTAAFITAVVILFFKEFRSSATDRAQVKAEAQAEGFARLGLPRVVKDGWMWVRPTLFASPAVCCGCGAAEAGKTLRRMLGGFGMSGVNVEARVCAACYRRATKKQAVAAVASFSVPMAAGMLIAMRQANWDGVDVCIGGFLGAFAGGLALAVMLNWVIRRVGFPIRFRKFRSRRDEVEVKFRSEAAAEEFLAGAIQRMQAQMEAAAAGEK